jgi:FAD binding domain
MLAFAVIAVLPCCLSWHLRTPPLANNRNAFVPSFLFSLPERDPLHKPNPCVGPIDRGPFYAVKLVIGDLGTFAGLRCDEYSRVLADNGSPIPGLHAAGNEFVRQLPQGRDYTGTGRHIRLHRRAARRGSECIAATF